MIPHKTLVGARRAACRSHRLAGAIAYLEKRGIQTLGVVRVKCAGRVAYYVNLGDTYATTIVRERGRFYIASWGAWYESVESAHCRENGVIRCGYCSAFTEKARNWRDTICGVCGHNVAGD